MNTPSLAAVGHAFAILLNSVYQDSGFGLRMSPSASPTFSELDYHIQAVEMTALAFHNKACQQLATLKRYRNSFAPIHKLPLELLSNILFDCLPPTPTINDLRKFALVSSYWLGMISSTPRFWTYVDYAFSAKDVHLLLRKSKNAGLRIACRSGDRESATLVEDFMSVVAQHAHRWDAVTFRGHGTPRIVGILESATSVKDVDVTYTFCYHPRWLLSLGKEAPIEHLTLAGAALDWDSCTISNLRSLHLQDIHLAPPTLRNLLDVIVTSPRLESLVLLDMGRNTTDDQLQPTAPGAPIHLPLLRTLDLHNIPSHISSYLLSHVVAPNIRRLLADNVSPQLLPSTSSSATSVPHLFHLIRPLLRGIERIKVSVEGRLNLIIVSTLPESHILKPLQDGLSVTFETRTAMDHLKLVSDLLRPTFDDYESNESEYMACPHPEPSVHLKVAKSWWWDDDHDDHALPPSVIANFPTLQRLELGKGVDGTDALRYLAERTPNTNAWPCPRLSVMVLKGWSGDSEMIGPFVARRWGVGARALGMQSMQVQRPVKLKVFEPPSDISESVKEAVKFAKLLS